MACGLAMLRSTTASSSAPSNLFLVDKDNQPYQRGSVSLPWYRATFLLIVHEPPHLYYEPKEWSETTVLLVEKDDILTLPGDSVPCDSTYEESAIQTLLQHNIDVCAPQNCLHHLFTFPFPQKMDVCLVAPIHLFLPSHCIPPNYLYCSVD